MRRAGASGPRRGAGTGSRRGRLQGHQQSALACAPRWRWRPRRAAVVRICASRRFAAADGCCWWTANAGRGRAAARVSGLPLLGRVGRDDATSGGGGGGLLALQLHAYGRAPHRSLFAGAAGSSVSARPLSMTSARLLHREPALRVIPGAARRPRAQRRFTTARDLYRTAGKVEMPTLLKDRRRCTHWRQHAHRRLPGRTATHILSFIEHVSSRPTSRRGLTYGRWPGVLNGGLVVVHAY